MGCGVEPGLKRWDWTWLGGVAGLAVGLVLLLSLSSLIAGCGQACDGAMVGSSEVKPLLTADWPYGDGSAAGAWKLTLTPNDLGTNCVLVSDNLYGSERYTYTLEFPGEAPNEIRVYIDGALFGSGEYEDASGESADGLVYQTEERLDDSRPAGAVRYLIEGEASLESNSRAGSLTWTGYESIVVLESDDPEIGVGCTFTYDVSGIKVCDE